MNWPFRFDFGAGTARLGELKSTFNVGIIKFQNGTAVSSKMELERVPKWHSVSSQKELIEKLRNSAM